MAQAVADILREIEQLSEPERRELRYAVVQNIAMSDKLTDDDFAALAAESCLLLIRFAKLKVCCCVGRDFKGIMSLVSCS